MSDWSWWQNALDGKFGPVHEGDPQQGYYKVREGRGGPFVPVAIWRESEGAWLCKRGKKSASAEDIWTSACKHPITYDVYTAVMGGADWPGTPPAAEIGHNLPEDPAERFKLELEAEKDVVDRILAAPVEDDEAASKCGLLSKRLGELAATIDGTRVELKRPHDNAAKQVQEVFAPLVNRADMMKRQLLAHMQSFMLEKKRKADEEERARREAERKAAVALDMPEPQARPAARTKSAVMTGGVTTRTIKVVRISDLGKAASFIAGLETPSSDFVDVVRKLSHRMLTAGISVPGAELVDETRVS
jgi:hypothetical protein